MQLITQFFYSPKQIGSHFHPTILAGNPFYSPYFTYHIFKNNSILSLLKKAGGRRQEAEGRRFCLEGDSGPS
jgi:urease beta subunit